MNLEHQRAVLNKLTEWGNHFRILSEWHRLHAQWPYVLAKVTNSLGDRGGLRLSNPRDVRLQDCMHVSVCTYQ
jgi:hypothetical protein